jgi:UDP-N-acetylmuramoyl-tripeptide--D-alanyl-D-alanine ligase
MAEALWTGEELRSVFGPAGIPSVTGISIDTRTLREGDLFFAIEGERTDGHLYIGKAFAAGAAAAVVKDGYDGAAPGPLVRAADTLEAMRALARAARERARARIVAVTGSVGKTGTKEMLRLMLGRLGTVHASDKSYNNHWGVPLSLARLPREADYAIFEIGMNHAGEIAPLTRLVRPHVAIVTTIAPVHIEFFDGIEGIAEAKAEIFQGLEPGGAAVLNRDNEQFPLLERRAAERGIARIADFGSAARAAARLLACEAGASGSKIEASISGDDIVYYIGAPGYHLAMNSVAALAAVKLLGGDIHEAAPALSAFGAPEGRGAQTLHRIGDGTVLLIDESYNANPASMAAALKVLGGLPREKTRRRIAVLGDMLELGSRSQALHEGLAASILAEDIDRVYCCGPYMQTLFAALPEEKRGVWAGSSGELQDALLAALAAGDAVMIKGSLGSHMALLVEAVKQRYPRAGQDAVMAAE